MLALKYLNVTAVIRCMSLILLNLMVMACVFLEISGNIFLICTQIIITAQRGVGLVRNIITGAHICWHIFLLHPWRRGNAWGGGDGGGEGPGDSGGNDGLDAFGGAGPDVSVDSACKS